MFSLGSLFLVGLLLVNAIAVLNEERFLARIGWGPQSVYGDFGQQHPPGNHMQMQQQGSDSSVKAKLIGLMSAVRTLMRLPLIAINTVAIVYMLLLG
ncbi:hypothetical protein GGF32_001743 [Allomyces javanicus]|nr:hypothetical protein GGF32_001743 [Allomyces javanicus]